LFFLNPESCPRATDRCEPFPRRSRGRQKPANPSAAGRGRRPKRQGAGALQDAGAFASSTGLREASWTAAALRRFPGGPPEWRILTTEGQKWA